MDLSMTDLLLHGKTATLPQFVLSSEHSKNDDFSGTALHLGCLGFGIDKATERARFQTDNDFSVPDDGCRLVLGLGPTPNLYSSDNYSPGADKAKESAVLSGQSYSANDPGVLKLGLSKCTSVPALPMPFSEKGSAFPVVDEGSTSAKRKSGGYMPSLLFCPRPETQDLLDGGNGNTDYYLANPHQFQLSPEPSATTDCSVGTTSELLVGAGAADQRNHHRHPKKCRFKGCSKGARGASGLCIAHGGGQRCQKPGCHKGAESRTAYCKAHGGGRRCQQLGCTKSAEGKTDHCIAHGGGRRCGHSGCTKAARGRSGLCIRHGGGKRCKVDGCTRSAEGQAGQCISHGGGRRCQHQGCRKGAQGNTMFCKAHGGGKRCVFEGCTKGAEGRTPLCKGHGGGKRCLFEGGGGVCPKSVHGGTSFCVAHGGGKRCSVPGCTKSARGRTDCCVRHGGGKRCKTEGCGKSAQGRTDFCKAHGGGKRCTWITGCDKFARGKSGLCAAHGSLTGKAGSMIGIGPGLFTGIVSVSATMGSGMDNQRSSSGMSTLSDCIESPEGTRRSRLLIPPQVLVPVSMKSSSSPGATGRSGEGGGGRQQSFGFVVPEGRVHGGRLMSLLGSSLQNAVDGGNI